MIPEYAEYRIIDVKKNGNSSNIIRVKCKSKVSPGQFFIGWIPGHGELTLPVCLYEGDNLEFSISKNVEIQEKAYYLKPKNMIYLIGPYGYGFPMNNLKHKDIILIGESGIFSPLYSALNYVLQNRKEFKKVKVIIYQKEENKDFIELIGKIDDKKEIEVLIVNGFNKILAALSEIDEVRGRNFLLSLKNKELKDAAYFLRKDDDASKQIYFYIPRKISCGRGICGTCAVFGNHACIDGPVFRVDRFERFFQ